MLKLISHTLNWPFMHRLFLRLHRNPHVLYYHMVGNKSPEYYYQNHLTPDIFRFQIEWLLRNKFEFVPLAEMNNNQANKRRVAITTDDGFVENYTCIAPILSEYNIPATFFLVNNCIDNKDLMWMNKLAVIENRRGVKNTKHRVYASLRDRGIILNGHRSVDSIYLQIPMKFKDEIANQIWEESQLPALPEFLQAHKPYMTSIQIDELLAAGFTIGAHTLTHPKCSRLSVEELEVEVVGSVKQLSENFNTRIDYFAYPFGLRPKQAEEEKVFQLSGVKAFLGSKNSDNKFNGNIIWERDKMEQAKAESLFWFSVIPMVRKFFLRPFGIYR